MGKKTAGERETKEREKAAAAAGTPPDTKKWRSGSPTATDGASSGPGAGLCDDVVGNILARVPARTAVASMALSRRHRRLIRSPEFRSLHRRLSPPLPRPHIAYLATAPVRTRLDGKDVAPVSVFQGFHVAGAGGFNGNAPMMPMRSLAGRRFSGAEYVNTCNGIVLLAGEKDREYSAPCKCILWNPAVEDGVEEVSVPGADASIKTEVREYRALGLGYGHRSKTYKLILLCRRRRRKNGGPAHGRRGHRGAFAGREDDGTEIYSLVTYALVGPDGKQPREVVEIPAVRGGETFSQHSLYMDDGKIYLHLKHNNTHPVLAFDVDDETVNSTDLPVALCEYGSTSGLMELSGRPCVVVEESGCGGCALWLLSVDHQWHRKCAIGEMRSEACIFLESVVGVWDCGGVLVLCYKDDDVDDPDRLFLYDLTAGKMFRANLDGVVTLECSESSELSICWGYRPTLEAPSSVVVGKPKLKQDEDGCRECSAYIMKALKPVTEQDRRRGQEATLNTVCFMDFLVRIMEKLPKDMQQVLEMKMMDSDDPDITFENILFRENI